MNPTQRRERGAVSIRTGVFLMLFIGLLAASYDGMNSSSATFATNPQAQTAQAATPSGAAAPPAASTVGQCQQQYVACEAQMQGVRGAASVCENAWSTCVSQKCVAKDTTSIDSCPKDPDCASSCTESATGQGGLLSCCDGGPQHNNACRKKIDEKCVASTAGTNTALSAPPAPPASNDSGTVPPPVSPSITGLGSPAGSGELTGAFNTPGAGIQPASGIPNDQMGTIEDWNAGYANVAPPDSAPAIAPGDYQGESPQAIDKALADSGVQLSPPNVSGCKTSSCADTQAGIYNGPNDVASSCPFGVCDKTNTFNQPPGNGGQPPPGNNHSGPDTPGNTGGGGNGGGGLGSGLSSLLSGLAKGLGGALGAPQSPPAAPAQACSTDPNVYAQQQQQYQQQLQQYNYQLQQAQYQQQMQQYYAQQQGGYGYPPPQQPLPAQPTPCSPSTQGQCSLQPQQPAASTCTAGSWRPIYSGNCIVNWQCSNLGAQLSCSPTTADVGMSLAISYSCAQGTATGQGFTASSTSGTTTVQIAAPPAGANTATYGLTCTAGNQTSGAQCSVQVTQPSIVLVANPATVSSGQTSQLGWVTTGMQSCVISSPQDAGFTAQNASNTSVNGTAVTVAITATSTEFDLACETLGGQTKNASTTVTLTP